MLICHTNFSTGDGLKEGVHEILFLYKLKPQAVPLSPYIPTMARFPCSFPLFAGLVFLFALFAEHAAAFVTQPLALRSGIF